MRLRYIFAATTVVLALLYNFSVTAPVSKFEQFAPLEWESLEGAIPGGADPRLFGARASIGNFTTRGKATRALSRYFSITSTELEIQLAGDLPQSITPPRLRLLSDSGAVLEDCLLQLSANANTDSSWKRVRIELDKDDLKAKLEITSTESEDSEMWFAIRNRVDFYQNQSKLHSFLQNNFSQLTIRIIFALILSFLLLQRLQVPLSTIRFLLLSLFLSLTVHFRWEVFFYFDEWNVLDRFQALGASGIVYTHNEHFLPLFFSWYYLESLFFGEHYLAYILTSHLLHVIQSFMISILLSRLFPAQNTASKGVSQFLALLYVVNPLHSEVLQWAFEQSLLLSHLSITASLLFGIGYFREGSKLKLAASLLFALVAPLFFGNGFSSLFILSTFLFFLLVHSPKEDFKAQFRRSLFLSAGVAILLIFPGVLYLLFRDGPGHTIEHMKPFEDPLAIINYIFIGSQFGTVLRGLGAFPNLDLATIGAWYLQLQEIIPLPAIEGASAERFFALLGFLLTLLLLGASVRSKQPRGLALWVLGQAILALSFLLPAIARWHFGAAQSLSLRYHSASLLGLMILLIPIALELRSKRHSASGLRFSPVVLCITIIMFLQFSSSAKYTYFSTLGANHRKYIEQFHDWRTHHYQNLETDQALEPALPKTLAPSINAENTYKILRFLDPSPPSN